MLGGTLAVVAFGRAAPAPSHRGVESELSESAPGVASVARLMVLPFEVQRGGERDRIRARALTVETVTGLGTVRPGRIEVLARASASLVEGGTHDLVSVAANLKVDYFVEGSIRETAEGATVTISLSRGSDLGRTWTRSFTSGREGLSSPVLAGEIAQAVARAVVGS
jgi:TolB-like protein